MIYFRENCIADMTVTLECVQRWLAVYDRDISEETGTAVKTLIRLVSLSIFFFLHGRHSIFFIKVRISLNKLVLLDQRLCTTKH